jgi:hypothetical protein
MPGEYALVAVSLLVYGLAAMRAAVWLLGREERLRAPELGSGSRWRLRRGRRRADEERARAA